MFIEQYLFSITRNKFLPLVFYQRVNGDQKYWKSNAKIKTVPKNTLPFGIKSKKHFFSILKNT